MTRQSSIDLAKVQLIEPAFALPYEFVVPDVMFEDEFLDLGGRYESDTGVKARHLGLCDRKVST